MSSKQRDTTMTRGFESPYTKAQRFSQPERLFSHSNPQVFGACKATGLDDPTTAAEQSAVRHHCKGTATDYAPQCETVFAEFHEASSDIHQGHSEELGRVRSHGTPKRKGSTHSRGWYCITLWCWYVLFILIIIAPGEREAYICEMTA